MDPEAAASVIGMDVPLVLVPYEAARKVGLGETDLEAIATTGPASRWVTDRARSWLKFWKTEVGRQVSTRSIRWPPSSCASRDGSPARESAWRSAAIERCTCP
jgi:hypothetical protein